MRRIRGGVVALVLLAGIACSRGPASLDVSPKKVKIYGLEKAQRMTVRVLDKKGQPIDGNPEWTSANGNIVATEPGGRLVAKGAGKTTVTATLGQITAQVPVEVVDVQSIDMATPAFSLLGPVGTTVPLSFTVKDSKGKAVDLKPTFTSHDPKIATVTDSGAVTSVSAGKTTIVGRIGDVQGASEVDVVIHAIARLEIRPATALVHVGDSQHFQVTAYGPDGAPLTEIAAAFKSSNPEVATVDSAGVASGRKAGAAVIRAELAGNTAEATLLVN